MKVTITDIAKDTGLALSTISRYLNHKKVQPENQVLIEASIKKLGYTPNRIAQGLRSKSSRSVALLIPFYSNYFWGQSVSYVTSALWEKGYTCTVHTYLPETDKQLKTIQLLISKKIGGVIAVSGSLSQEALNRLEDNGVPIVLLDQVLSSLSVDYVTSDNYQGGYMAGSYLAGKGHKKIGFIASEPGTYTICQRTRGFLDALQDHQIPSIPQYYSYQTSAYPAAEAQLQHLLSLKEPPTALFFCYYESCLSGISELAKYNISVPEKISIIGFDDDPLFSSLAPSITVIAQDFLTIGKEATKILLSRISGEDSSPGKKVLVPVRLIERESVAAI